MEMLLSGSVIPTAVFLTSWSMALLFDILANVFLAKLQTKLIIDTP